MLTKTQAIKNFLKVKARPDFADTYGPHMEVQVMVGRDGGEKIEGIYEGHQWSGWTDGLQTWKAIRIPFHANTNPEYVDTEIKFDLAAHAEAIGMTGWDWVARKSRWVAFDFDAILGHAEGHTKKLSDEQLKEVRDIAINIPWVTVRQSTSGNGLHLYVYLEGVDTANHNEHSALGRAILAKMSAITGYDFLTKVDNCGGNIWIWHRKFESAGGINGPGLKLIRKGEVLTEIPPNWRDHIKVVKGSTKKSLPSFIEAEDEKSEDVFLELCGQRPVVPLDSVHRELIKFLEESRHPSRDWWWDNDNHMLVCHTLDLQEAHKRLGLKGIFKTSSSGSSTQNCFCFPMRKGAWAVRRHSQGVIESDSWEKDASGWTKCYFNREPDLNTASKINGGNENDKGAFVFTETETAIETAASLGAHVELPNFMMGRQATLRPHKDGKRLIFEIERTDTDNAEKMKGWILKRGPLWQKVLNTNTPAKHEDEISNYEDIVRHLVTEHAGKDAGWVVKSDGKWYEERCEHIKFVLCSLGLSKDTIAKVMGSGVTRKWTIVNRPFQPEYPGDRIWNREAVQFAFAPALDIDSLHFDDWLKVLAHCGSGLDSAVLKNSWCKVNNVKTGGDYLMLWIAWMLQRPMEQLPYLFFYGPEGSGKSIFHESIELLLTKGVQRADAALISQQGFNGELVGKILCVVEETDLRQGKGAAINRIKDWVTARSAPIHGKGGTPYSVQNSWHWCQTANDIGFCPTFPGDTRIVVTYVKELDAEIKINKSKLLALLQKQAPDFLAHILRIDLPEPDDRLNLPVLITEEKKQAQSANRTTLEEFVSECTYPVCGEVVKLSELFDKFIEWLPPSMVGEWSNIRFGRELVKLGYVKGRHLSKGSHFYVANISLSNITSTKVRIWADEDRLVIT